MNNKTAELLERHFDIAVETPEGVKKLRELILTLAMQGKLVSQNDKTASIPYTKLTSVKNSDYPYPVPNHWTWVRLGDLEPQYQNGISKRVSSIGTETIVLRLADIQNGNISLENTRTIRLSNDEREKYSLEQDDILITRVNGSVDIVGSFTRVNNKLDAAYCDHFIRLKTKHNLIDSNYLCICSKSAFIRKQISNKFITTAGQKTVNQTHISSLLFPIPPLAEQKRIVAKIDQLMSLCDKLEAQRDNYNNKRLKIHTAATSNLLSSKDSVDFNKSWHFITRNFDELYSVPENVTELKKVILQLAVMGKLVKQDPKEQPASELLKEIEEEKKKLVKEGKVRNIAPLEPIKDVPYGIPSNWKWVRLIDIAEYNGRPNAAPDEIEQDTWVLDLEDIEKETSRIIARARYKDRQSKSTKSTFCKGDVLYGKLRPYLNKVVVADSDGVCTTEIVPIVPYKGIDSFFLKHILMRPSFIDHVNALSYGVKMPRLGTSDAINSIHPLPPNAEQKRIVAKIDKLMSLCDTLVLKVSSSTAKQTSILNAVLSKI